MRLAWTLHRSPASPDFSMSFSAALRQAWLVVKTREALARNRTLITFRKDDGTVTRRLATAFARCYRTQDRRSRQSSPLVTPFYSITDQATRSFRIDRLLAFTPVPPLPPTA